MNIYANQLSQHLKTNKGPYFYVLVGQEPFLIEQSYNHLRQFAKKHGYEERQVFTYDSPSNFAWESLIQSLASQNMFAQNQVIEWSWQSAKFEADLALLDGLLPPTQTTMLIIKAGPLTKAQQNAKWFKQLTKGATLVAHWAPRPHELPRWIDELAKQKGLTLNTECCQFLAHQYEGRLSKLAQHLDKLALSHQGAIQLTELNAHLDDQFAFDVFHLQSALLGQSKEKVITILSHLKQQKTEINLVLWCLGRLLESFLMANNKDPHDNQWLKARGIWANEHAQFWQLAQQIERKKIENELKSLQQIDANCKTGQGAQGWQLICTMCLNIIGALPHMYL